MSKRIVFMGAGAVGGYLGWGKVVGCIASTIGVDASKAGHVIRAQQLGRVRPIRSSRDEVHGRITPRVQDIVRC